MHTMDIETKIPDIYLGVQREAVHELPEVRRRPHPEHDLDLAVIVSRVTARAPERNSNFQIRIQNFRKFENRKISFSVTFVQKVESV